VFSNTYKLILFTLRRELKYILIWLLSIVAFNYVVCLAFPNLYPDDEAIAGFMSAYNIPSMRSMIGPVFGYEGAKLTISMIFSMECLLWLCMPVAIMNIFFVIRNTRSDEEQGRQEQLLALPVGRLAKQTAVMMSAFFINVLFVIALTFTTFATQIDGMTFAGALSYSLSIGCTGIIFACISLLTSELFSTSSGATGFAFFIFLLSFIMRASGDMNESILSYLSPLGLPLMTFPFYDNNNIWLLYLLLVGVCLTAISFVILYNRDMGSGIIPANKGRAEGKIKSVYGLAFRLTRITFISWAIGIFLIGLSYGSVIPEIDKFLMDNGTLSSMVEASGGTSMIDNYLSMIILLASMLIAVPVIILFGKLYGEEKRNRIEQIYSLPVSRYKNFASYFSVSLLALITMPLFLALGIFVVGKDYVELSELLSACYVYVPAIVVMLGLECLFIGLFPKIKILNWLIFAYSFIVLYFGRILDVPEWTTKISPFGNIAQLPVQKLSATPLYVLSAVGVLLIYVGFRSYRNQDLG